MGEKHLEHYEIEIVQPETGWRRRYEGKYQNLIQAMAVMGNMADEDKQLGLPPVEYRAVKVETIETEVETRQEG